MHHASRGAQAGEGDGGQSGAREKAHRGGAAAGGRVGHDAGLQGSRGSARDTVGLSPLSPRFHGWRGPQTSHGHRRGQGLSDPHPTPRPTPIPPCPQLRSELSPSLPRKCPQVTCQSAQPSPALRHRLRKEEMGWGCGWGESPSASPSGGSPCEGRCAEMLGRPAGGRGGWAGV